MPKTKKNSDSSINLIFENIGSYTDDTVQTIFMINVKYLLRILAHFTVTGNNIIHCIAQLY